MKYHARLDYGEGSHYWWNHSKQQLISKMLIPFVNGQVILVTAGKTKKVLNMKNVTYLTVYKTDKDLDVSSSSSIPVELKELSFQKNECTEEFLNEVKSLQANVSMQSLLQKAFAPPRQQVFVIMKFQDKELDSAYEGVIKPLIIEMGLQPLRIDEIQDSGKITDQVLDNIATSKYIIADLTGERPNCYYECGFAQALGKDIVLTIKTDSDIHFDLAGYRFIQWETESELRKKLKERFNSLINIGQS